MSEVVTVKLSPNCSTIMYVERLRTDLETDFSESLSTLKEKQKDTLRVVVYCRTLMICADQFSRFSGEKSLLAINSMGTNADEVITEALH